MEIAKKMGALKAKSEERKEKKERGRGQFRLVLG